MLGVYGERGGPCHTYCIGSPRSKLLSYRSMDIYFTNTSLNQNRSVFCSMYVRLRVLGFLLRVEGVGVVLDYTDKEPF